MASTSIEWTRGDDGSKGATWNPVSGCEAVSPGCARCYAATMTRRLEAMGQADYAGLTTAKHFNGVVRCLPHKLDVPLKWRKPRRVFVNSMSDLFHPDVSDEFIDKVFAVMALCPQHSFQVLTKRAERMHRYLSRHDIGLRWATAPRRHLFAGEKVIASPETAADWTRQGLPNVWLGVSAEDQQRADERIPWLLKTPAAVRFISAEPLLGPTNFDEWLSSDYHYFCCECDDNCRKDYTTCPDYPQRHGADGIVHHGLSWLIVGCESGPGRRPCELEWLTSIVRQCQAAGVPCFVKQDAGPRSGMQGRIPDDVWAVKEFPRVRA